MATLEHLDLLLGEALENIIEASSEIRDIDILEHKEALRHLGKATAELWSIRETIYSLKPDVKRDFIREHEQNRMRYEELSKLQERAYQAEMDSNFEAAIELYQELRQSSRFGYFCLIAEAGLYRLTSAES